MKNNIIALALGLVVLFFSCEKTLDGTFLTTPVASMSGFFSRTATTDNQMYSVLKVDKETPKSGGGIFFREQVLNDTSRFDSVFAIGKKLANAPSFSDTLAAAKKITVGAIDTTLLGDSISYTANRTMPAGSVIFAASGDTIIRVRQFYQKITTKAVGVVSGGVQGITLATILPFNATGGVVVKVVSGDQSAEVRLSEPIFRKAWIPSASPNAIVSEIHIGGPINTCTGVTLQDINWENPTTKKVGEDVGQTTASLQVAFMIASQADSIMYLKSATGSGTTLATLGSSQPERNESRYNAGYALKFGKKWYALIHDVVNASTGEGNLTSGWFRVRIWESGAPRAGNVVINTGDLRWQLNNSVRSAAPSLGLPVMEIGNCQPFLPVSHIGKFTTSKKLFAQNGVISFF